MVWPINRADWVRSFENLSRDFKLTFLSGTFASEVNAVREYANTITWSEFDSAQAIIDQVRPDALIFMSIDSGLSMALNHAAKKRGLTTMILQHGVYTNYRDYRIRERLWKKAEKSAEVKTVQRQAGFSTLNFVKRSLPGLRLIWLPFVAIYTQLAHRKGPYWAAKNLPLAIKRADYYLCFSDYNATIHRQLDRIGERRIHFIQSTELHSYLGEESTLIQEPFYLHIDQALAENSFGEETVSKDQMISFYGKLNDYCLDQKARLYIKLHPESYHSSWLPQHENIVYLRNVENFNHYIQSAKGCFGFYSTMVIPAVYWKPTVLFEIQYSGLQERLKKELGLSVLSFRDFTLDKELFNETGSAAERKKRVKEVFMSKGSLKNVILELTA